MTRFIEFTGGDVEAYLQAQEQKDLLRFITCGSVDDGKSTLIGRLLYDSKAIFEDQLEAVEATSQSKGYDYTDLALLDVQGTVERLPLPGAAPKAKKRGRPVSQPRSWDRRGERRTGT